MQIPDHLSANTADGTRVTLGRSQLEHAATVITVGGRTHGVGPAGIKIALMAALTESSLRMLSNSAAYPESASLPNDGDGSDHDSLGMFQMRPSTGWGTVQQLMDPDYQARAFFGGPAGPNHGSPRGLLDIPGWQQMTPGAAAQAVEVSAYPDRYANYEPVAEAILRTLTSAAGAGGGPIPVPESTRVVFPLPAGTWQRTDTFGPRTDPVTGEPSMHTGVDYAAPAGTAILAVADGRVVFAGPVSSGYAHLILIEHTIGGRTVVSGYAHMYADGIHVRGEPDRHRRPAHRRRRRRRQRDRPPSALRDPARRSRGRGDRPRALARRPRSRQPRRGVHTQPGGLRARITDRRRAVRRRQPQPAGRRPDVQRPDHRADGVRARPGPSPVPQHVVGLLARAATRAPSTRTAAPATAPSATRSASQPPGHALSSAGR